MRTLKGTLSLKTLKESSVRTLTLSVTKRPQSLKRLKKIEISKEDSITDDPKQDYLTEHPKENPITKDSKEDPINKEPEKDPKESTKEELITKDP